MRCGVIIHGVVWCRVTRCGMTPFIRKATSHQTTSHPNTSYFLSSSPSAQWNRPQESSGIEPEPSVYGEVIQNCWSLQPAPLEFPIGPSWSLQWAPLESPFGKPSYGFGSIWTPSSGVSNGVSNGPRWSLQRSLRRSLQWRLQREVPLDFETSIWHTVFAPGRRLGPDL